MSKSLVMVYDVSDLSDAQLDALIGETTAMGESSERGGFSDDPGHPDVDVLSYVVPKPMKDIYALIRYEADRG